MGKYHQIVLIAKPPRDMRFAETSQWAMATNARPIEIGTDMSTSRVARAFCTSVPTPCACGGTRAAEAALLHARRRGRMSLRPGTRRACS